VRHCCRLYVVGANMTVPVFSVVLRKAYGLGSQGMVGGSFHLPMFSVAWPTGEFGPMNLEGSVKLGFRRNGAIADPAQRKARFEMVAEAYQRGRRSAPRPCSRSTMSSTPRTRVHGSWRDCARYAAKPRMGRSALLLIHGELILSFGRGQPGGWSPFALAKKIEDFSGLTA